MVSVIRVWATETVRIDTLGCIFKKIMNIFFFIMLLQNHQTVNMQIDDDNKIHMDSKFVKHVSTFVIQK